MSRRRAQALRPQIDQKTADYIDAAIAAAITDHVREAHGPDTETTTFVPEDLQPIENELIELRSKVALLEGREPDERYTLTRARLIKALKKMGITTDG